MYRQERRNDGIKHAALIFKDLRRFLSVLKN